MDKDQVGTTICVELLDKSKIPQNLHAELQGYIVTIRRGENTLTLLRPNIEIKESKVRVHEDGLTAAELPLATLTQEVKVSELDSDTRRTVITWVLRRYGHALGYELFPDLKPSYQSTD